MVDASLERHIIMVRFQLGSRVIFHIFNDVLDGHWKRKNSKFVLIQMRLW